MNMVKQILERVFTEQLPAGTTRFHTQDGYAHFLIGATGQWETVEMTDDQKSSLKASSLHGSLGWALQ